MRNRFETPRIRCRTSAPRNGPSCRRPARRRADRTSYRPCPGSRRYKRRGRLNRSIDALGAAGAEFQNRAALRGPDDTIGFRGDEALMVDRQQQKRLDQLRLNGRRADGQNRLARENRRALRDGPDIAREVKIAQIRQKPLGKQLPAVQIREVLGSK